MKKVIYIMSLLFVTILLLGCNKQDNVELISINFEDEQFGFLTTFEYDKTLDYSLISGPVIENEYATMIMTSERLNLKIDFAYDELTKEQYDINKKSVSKYDSYKEYKYNGYNAYAFATGDDALYAYIIFSNNQNSINPALYIQFSLIDMNNKTDLKKIYNSNEIQSLLKSIKFQKINNN